MYLYERASFRDDVTAFLFPFKAQGEPSPPGWKGERSDAGCKTGHKEVERNSCSPDVRSVLQLCFKRSILSQGERLQCNRRGNRTPDRRAAGREGTRISPARQPRGSEAAVPPHLSGARRPARSMPRDALPGPSSSDSERRSRRSARRGPGRDGAGRDGSGRHRDGSGRPRRR